MSMFILDNPHTLLVMADDIIGGSSQDLGALIEPSLPAYLLFYINVTPGTSAGPQPKKNKKTSALLNNSLHKRIRTITGFNV